VIPHSKCPICGLPKGRPYHHAKCSRILQAAAQARPAKSRNYKPLTQNEINFYVASARRAER
jgi:hypothetical protein